MSEKEMFQYIKLYNFHKIRKKLTEIYSAEIDLDSNNIKRSFDCYHLFVHEDKFKREDYDHIKISIDPNVYGEEYENKDLYMTFNNSLNYIAYVIDLTGKDVWFNNSDDDLSYVSNKRKMLVFNFDDFYQEYKSKYDEFKDHIEDKYHLLLSYWNVWHILQELQDELLKYQIASVVIVSKKMIGNIFDCNLEEINFSISSSQDRIIKKTYNNSITMTHNLSFDKCILMILSTVKYVLEQNNFKYKVQKRQSAEELIESLKPSINDAITELKDKDVSYLLSKV